MRRALAIAIVVLVAVAVAAPTASAITPTERRLIAQVKTLQKQVKTLQRQVRQAQAIGALGVVFSACNAAATADAFQSTWATLDAKIGPTFGAQQPVNDYGMCTTLRIQRARPVPATTAVFQNLLNLLRS